MRRLSVSTLAWPAEDSATALALLTRWPQVEAIELAPVQMLGPWEAQPEEKIAALRARLQDSGLRVHSLQGWLFGVSGASLFGAGRPILLAHTARVAAMAAALGASICVYGAPRTRDPGSLAADAAWQEASVSLRAMAEQMAAAGLTLTLEANAALYDCRFVTHTAEAAQLVQEIAHPALALQFDLGTVLLNDEALDALPQWRPLVRHVHISAPHLASLTTIPSHVHQQWGAALRTVGWDGIINLEMKAQPAWQQAVAASLDILTEYYA